MLGLALALIVVGIVVLFLVPWVGIPVGLVGVVLAVAYVAGWGRQATTHDRV